VSESSRIKKVNWLKTGLLALGILTTIIVVFGAGFWIGRSSVSPFGFFSPVVRSQARNHHGATGVIQDISDQRITLRTRDGKTQVILVNAETRFDKGFKQIAQSERERAIARAKVRPASGRYRAAQEINVVLMIHGVTYPLAPSLEGRGNGGRLFDQGKRLWYIRLCGRL